jgi:ligand-binding sensor protein
VARLAHPQVGDVAVIMQRQWQGVVSGGRDRCSESRQMQICTMVSVEWQKGQELARECQALSVSSGGDCT